MAPTDSEIADAISGRYGVVPSRFKWARRTAAFLLRDDISVAVVEGSTPELTMDSTRHVVRDISGIEFRVDALPGDFDATQDFIGVVEERLIDGAWEEFPLGLYRLDVGETRYEDDGDRIMTAQAADVGILLTETGPATPYTVAAATTYKAAAEAILNTLSLAHALPTDGNSTPLTLTWPPFPDTTWFKILDDLYAGINYRVPWPGLRGEFTTEEQTDPSAKTSNVTFTDTAEPKMLDAESPYIRRDEPGVLPNNVVVEINDPRHTNYGSSQRFNNEAASIISTANRATIRRKVDAASVPSTKAILNDTIAIAIATYLLRLAVTDASRATLSTFIDPRRDVHEFFTLTVEDAESATLWRSIGWKRPLSFEGVMSHLLGKAQSISVSAS